MTSRRRRGMTRSLPSINALKRSRVPLGCGCPSIGVTPSLDDQTPTRSSVTRNRPMVQPLIIQQFYDVTNDDASLKASNKSWVVCDHPGELRPRIPLRENCIKIFFNRGCSFHSDPPFVFGEWLFSDGVPETYSCEQLPDFLVVATALQAADEIGCRPRLEPVEP